MLQSLRWLITSVLFNSGIAYAAFTAFRHPKSMHVLKLWMVLGTLLAVIELLGDTVCAAIPLFFEGRCLFVWCLIILEPVAWGSAYDAGCAPALSYIGSAAKAVRSSDQVRRGTLTALVGGTRVLGRFIAAAVSVSFLTEEEERVRRALGELEAALLSEKTMLQAK